MPQYDLTGTVKVVSELRTFASGFTKREFVVTTEDERFPQDIPFECVKERTSLLDNVKPGQRIKVKFDLRGREYNDRYFVNLNAWRIEAASDAKGGAGDDEPPLADPDDMPEEQEPPF